VRIDLLYFNGCPSHEALEPVLRELIKQEEAAARIKLRRIESVEEAERALPCRRLSEAEAPRGESPGELPM